MRQLMIAVDFDGTVIDENGRSLEGATNSLRELARRGHRLYLWTCREGPGLDEAAAWFQQRGIPLAGVNQNAPHEMRWRNRKLYADVYVDDRVVGGFPGWLTVMAWARILEASPPARV